MLTVLELEYLLCGIERIASSGSQPAVASSNGRHQSGRRSSSASDRQFERQRNTAVAQLTDELLVECFELLSTEEKRKFFQLHSTYEKVGFLLRAGAFRQSADAIGTLSFVPRA